MGNGASKERPRRSPSAFNLGAEVSGRRGERNRGFPVISGGRIPNLLAGIALRARSRFDGQCDGTAQGKLRLEAKIPSLRCLRT